MRNTVLSIVAGLLVLSASAVFAGEPVVDINPRLHPSLAAAQRLSRKAYNKIVTAQKANEFDMEGHAQKAKDLLDQVNLELKLAAEAANANKMK
jgi:hypothetical protein